MSRGGGVGLAAVPILPEKDLGGISIEVDLTIYELEAVLRACYKLTDHLYLLLTEHRPGVAVNISAWPKGEAVFPRDLAGRLSEELLEQNIRLLVEHKTSSLRELIVAQAFAEGNLLDPLREEGDYEADPLAITRPR